MLDSVPLLLTGILFGLAYSAVPGAVNTEALRQGIAGGFKPAWLIQTGALVGDLFWAVIGLTGAVVLIQFDAVAIGLGIIGAGFLFTLARSAFRSAFDTSAHQTDVASNPRNALLTGIAFSLANPAGLAFWTGIGGGLLGTSGSASPATLIVMLTGFTAGAALWGTGMALALTWSRRFAQGRVFRYVDALCGIALSYFGVRLLWTTVQRTTRWLAPLTRLAT